MARTMQDRSVDVFGSIPGSWQTRRTKDVFRQTPRKKIHTVSKYVGLEHISSWDGRATPIDLDDATFESAQPIRKGTICFAKLRPYLAKAFQAEDDLLGTSELLTIRALRSIAPKYALHWLLSYRFISALNDSVVGTKMPRVDWSVLSTMPFPLPGLEEQRRIAAWLDIQTGRIDKRLELLGKKREFLRELRRNLIDDTLASGLKRRGKVATGLAELAELPEGWKASQAKRLTRFTTSGSRGWAEYYADDGDLFLRIGNLTRETIELDLSDVQHVRLPANAAEGRRTRVRAGDMLVSITADLGSIAVADDRLDRPAYVNQHIALCRPKDSIHPRWLGYAMLSSQSKRQMMSSGYGGTKIQLSLDDVRRVWLAVPPPGEQREIAAFLDDRLAKIARQIALIDRLETLLKEQRKAVIHEAVTGKIDLSAYTPQQNPEALAA